MTSLRIHRENAVYELKELEAQYTDSLSDKQLLKCYKQYIERLHFVAYIGILADTDYHEYEKNLLRSSENWSHLLTVKNQDKQTIPSSFLLPVFGLLALGHFDKALELVEQSSTQRVQPEYADEFHYAQLIYLLVLNSQKPVTADMLQLAINNFKASLGDMDPTRAIVCQSIVEKDQALFHESIANLNDAFLQEMEQKSKSSASSTLLVETTSHFWLEGIALIKLAKQYELEVNFDYPAIPYLVHKDSNRKVINDCILGKFPFPGK